MIFFTTNIPVILKKPMEEIIEIFSNKNYDEFIKEASGGEMIGDKVIIHNDDGEYHVHFSQINVDVYHASKESAIKEIDSLLEFKLFQSGVLSKARGLGLNVVHCLSVLKDYSPIKQEAGKNNIGVAFVDRKGAKIEILPFDAPKEYHHVVIGRPGAGMSYFEQGDELSKLTFVLQAYDEDAIKEALEKNYYLDLKNLIAEDIKKVVEFLLERAESKVEADNLMRKCRSLGVHCLWIPSDTCNLGRPVKPKKQPDYRKFEKNKRF